MALILEGQVGPQILADGSNAALRQDRTAALVVVQGRPEYAEMTLRGDKYSATTATGGVAPGTAIGTTAPYTLYNPLNSGKHLILTRASLAYVSGTLGTGTCYLVVNRVAQAAAPSGTAITPVNHLIGSAKAAAALAFTTATLPVAPTVLRPFCTLAPMLASSVVQPFQVLEEFFGGLVVGQGSALSFESVAAAGTSPLLVFSMSWLEVDA